VPERQRHDGAPGMSNEDYEQQQGVAKKRKLDEERDEIEKPEPQEDEEAERRKHREEAGDCDSVKSQ
jgi:hypothetical protein